MNRITTIGIGWVAVAIAQSAPAASCIWTGGSGMLGNNNWSTAANWNGCGGAHLLPADGDALSFSSSASRLASNNDLAKLRITQLSIDAGVTLSGNTLGLTGGIVVHVSSLLVGNAPVIQIPLVLFTNAQTFQCAAGKPLSITGTVNLNGNALTVDTASGGNVSLNGNVVGAGGVTKTGIGTLFMAGPASTYTGTTTISSGTIEARSDAALGAAGAGNETIVDSGATLRLNLGHTIDETLVLNGSGQAGLGALANESGNNAVTGPITIASSSVIINDATDTTLTIGGDIDGSPLLTGGGATIRLQNVTSIPSVVAASGILEENGVIQAISVNPPATLAGNGVATSIFLQPANASDVSALSPGANAGNAVGAFTADDLTWPAGAKMVFQLGADPELSDRLILANAFTKAAGAGGFEFHFSDAATPPLPGVAYTLVSFSSTGFVAGDFSFSYTGSDAGAAMTGTFTMTATELQFTPATVVSDLIFRGNNE